MKKEADRELSTSELAGLVDEPRLGEVLSGEPFEVVISGMRIRVGFIRLLEILESDPPSSTMVRIIEKDTAEKILAAFGMSMADLEGFDGLET